MRAVGLPEVLIIGFMLLVVSVVPYWKIFRKAGFPAPLSLVTLIPVVGLIVLYVVAFSDWPALRNVRQQ